MATWGFLASVMGICDILSSLALGESDVAETADVSLIILSWNTLDLTRACLRELEVCRQGSHLSFEIIVIDNDSQTTRCR